MKHVYIGKPCKSGYEVCMVIDSRISTGEALVFNRATKTIEIIPFNNRRYIDSNSYKLYQDTEHEHAEAFRKACKKYVDFIKKFSEEE